MTFAAQKSRSCDDRCILEVSVFVRNCLIEALGPSRQRFAFNVLLSCLFFCPAFPTDFQRLRLMENVKSLVSGPKVKHLTFAEVPYRPAAKTLSRFPRFLEHHCIGRRHMERLVVHLRLGEGELSGQAPGDGMTLKKRLDIAWFAVCLVLWKAAVRPDNSHQRAAVRLFFIGYRRRQLGIALGRLSN